MQCVECKHEFEISKKISEPNPECPKCKNKTEIIIVTTPIYHLKGGGWHNAEYDKTGPYVYTNRRK
jgi:putative FmdB family regulatory protein